MRQDAGVPAVLDLLGNHPADFVVAKHPVAAIQPPVAVAEGIGTEEDRSLFAVGTGNLDPQQGLAVNDELLDRGVAEQVDAHFLAAVGRVEEFLAHLGGIGDAVDAEDAFFLPQAENHHAALGVGEGAVARPEVFRHRSLPCPSRPAASLHSKSTLSRSRDRSERVWSLGASVNFMAGTWDSWEDGVCRAWAGL